MTEGGQNGCLPDDLTPGARRLTLTLCGVLHGFTHAYMVLMVPLVFQIQQDFGLSSLSRAMSLLAVLAMSYCLACLPAGVMADHMSRRTALAAGLFLNGLAFVALSQCRVFGLAVAVVAFAGVAGGLYHPAANALVVGLYPSRPGRAIGFVGMGAALGFAFGPWFGGWRGGQAGWRQPCLELGLAGMAVAVAFACLAKDPTDPARASRSRADSVPLAPVLGVFVLISLMFSLREFGGLGIKPLTTVFLQRVHAFTEAHTGRCFAYMSLTALIANPLFGALSDGRHRLRVAALVLVASGLSVCAVPWVPRAWVIAPLAGAEFFLLASFPVMEAALAESVPDRLRGRVLGLFITVGGVIGAAAPVVVGLLADGLGDQTTRQPAYRGAFALLGVCVALSSVGLLVLRAFRRRGWSGPALP